MPLSMYRLAVETYIPVLRTLAELLDKAADHARSTGGDAAELASARLAPDMYPLARQVEIACHLARDGVARLAGREPAAREQRDLAFADLPGLIAGTIDGLASVNAEALAGAEQRRIEVPLQGSLAFESDGFDYLRSWSLPNFYFHVVTAYDILRHSGVPIGKRDYMSHVRGHVRARDPA